MPKETYSVVVDRPKRMTAVDMKRYMDDALNSWWGQMRPPGGEGPDDPGDPRWGLEFSHFKRVATPGVIKVLTPQDRDKMIRDLTLKLWGQFYDKRPPGDPKDTLRAILTALENGH